MNTLADVTSPNDLNGDSIFNNRPVFSAATCATTRVSPSNPNRYCTSLGTFDAIPIAGERIVPINYGTGPAHFVLNQRLAQTIGLPEGAVPKTSTGNISLKNGKRLSLLA
jgi:hypothetical protein